MNEIEQITSLYKQKKFEIAIPEIVKVEPVPGDSSAQGAPLSEQKKSNNEESALTSASINDVVPLKQHSSGN